MKVVVGGIFLLAVVMGIGRFSYTPLLPLMQVDLGLNSTVLGYLATSNYAGYFVGAISLSWINLKNSRYSVLALALMVNILTTFTMGIFIEYWILLTLRFLSGVSSAVVFILSSSIVLNYIVAKGKVWWSGIFYSGVGLGIALSSISIIGIDQGTSWQLMWMLLGVISFGLGSIGYFLVNQTSAKTILVVTNNTPQKSYKSIRWLIVAYGFEGIGYIVTGTFIVSITNQIPEIVWDSTLIWLIVGIAAIPSCLVWSRLAERWQYEKALTIALVIQAIGILLPAFVGNTMTISVSAILFGFTFMGITTLANAIAREYGQKVLSGLTAMYAAGQMLGPPIAGKLIDYFNYEVALIFATFCILCAICLTYRGQQKNEHEQIEIMEG